MARAWKVRGLKPDMSLRQVARRVLGVRTAEFYSYAPFIHDPARVTELHDMRIAAKRLRYILEVTAPCFGPYAAVAVRTAKELQDLLGEIHDCDVQLPDVRRRLARVVVEDARALAAAGASGADLEPGTLREAPHRHTYAGLVALTAYLQARRDLLFARFLDFWTDLERKGFAARLEYALTERGT